MGERPKMPLVMAIRIRMPERIFFMSTVSYVYIYINRKYLSRK
jgi:hypothetical protein